MNEMIHTIISRRSCKKFKEDDVPQETINQIVEAGLYAANGKGLQSPIIIVVTEKSTREKLSQLNRKYDEKNRPDPFYGAPVILVVLANKKISTAVYDGSLVIGNMMLAAHVLGVGSCWVHRAKEVFEDDEGKEILKEIGVEGDYEGIGHCIIGYPAIYNSNKAPRREKRVYRII